MNKYYMTWEEFFKRIQDIAEKNYLDNNRNCLVYGIPRGGMICAGFLCDEMGYIITHDPTEADLLIDDIVDSGRTKNKYININPKAKFVTLVDKINNEDDKNLGWIVFPWENDTEYDDLIVRILEYKNMEVNSMNINLIKDTINNVLESDGK